MNTGRGTLMRYTKLILVILILCLPLATALYAGNQEIITLDVSPSSCVMIDNKSNPLSNYNLDGLNLTINGTKVIINTHPALMPGDYTLVCNYTQTEETTTNSGGGSGGSSGSTSWVCGNWSECINNKSTMICFSKTNKRVNYTQTKSCVSETEQPKEKEKPKTNADEPETKVISNNINITEKIKIVEKSLNESNETPEEGGSFGFIVVLLVIIVGVIGYIIYRRNSESYPE